MRGGIVCGFIAGIIFFIRQIHLDDFENRLSELSAPVAGAVIGFIAGPIFLFPLILGGTFILPALLQYKKWTKFHLTVTGVLFGIFSFVIWNYFLDYSLAFWYFGIAGAITGYTVYKQGPFIEKTILAKRKAPA
jgi:hypothetical protein